MSVGYLAVGRAGLGKLFFATNDCNACGVCEASCPVGAVEMRGDRPFWTWDCESCMRCMSFCPRKAIDVSHSFAELLGAAIAVPVLPWLFGRALPLWLDWPLSTLLWGLELVVCYRLLWWLSGARWVRTLMSWTTATTLYRRHRAPGVRLKELTGGARLPVKNS